MTLTVAQALKIGGLVSGRLLAGARNLGNIIEHVDVIETPYDSDWATENYLCLTTFHAVKDSLEAQIRTIDMLVKSKSAGMVFHPEALTELHSAVIQRAEELGLPLIQVPKEVHYIDILPPLTGIILQEKSFILQRAQDTHERLISVVLEGGELEAIASTLSKLINRPVTITNAWGQVLSSPPSTSAWSSPASPADGLKSPDEGSVYPGDGSSGSDDSPVSSSNRPADSIDLRNRQASLGTSSAVDDTEKIMAVIQTIAIRQGDAWKTQPFWDGDLIAWIFPLFSQQPRVLEGFIVIDDTVQEMDQFDTVAVKQAANIAALELVKLRVVRETEKRLKRDFIEDLLGGGYHSIEAIMTHARALGWDLTNKRVVSLVDLNQFGQHSKASIKLGESQFIRIKEQLLYEIDQVMLEYNPHGIMIDQGNSIVLLPHCEPEMSQSQLHRAIRLLGERIHGRVEEKFRDWKILIAIGSFYDSVEGLRDSYNEARTALDVMLRIAGDCPIIFYDDVSLYVLLDRFIDRTQVIRWLEHTLGPLLVYDKNHGTELVKTIEVFFDSNQSMQQASEELYIHRKTLKYRLQRISEIMETDILSGDRKLSYYMATKLVKILELE